ncbi:hypothetical protein ONZ45_g506 [Pleurotus djamor]|nr:hypothetical protein ONZ45_g506 [Pleurotus djamor]
MEFFNDVGNDPLKPSLFELVAQEQLRDLLQPALKYTLAVFAQRYPRYLLRIVNRHEEFYALIMLFVERHYLVKHNASFSENFYGLKRRRRPYIEMERTRAAVGGIPAGEKLGSREIWRSLVLLVGVPYLRAKSQDLYEELGGGVSSEIMEEGLDARQIRMLTDESFRGQLRRGFKALYPWLNTLFELWLLASNIAYLFDRTPFYRPWLAWIGVDLRRLGVEDYRAANAISEKGKQALQASGLWARLKQIARRLPHRLLDSLRLLLPTAIFFVKFLEWWYSPNSPAQSLSKSPLGPAVPPPKMLAPHPQGIHLDRNQYGKCPICRKSINNATALPSGYVFCYRCAYEHVEKEGKCPVTLLPARFGKLIQAQQVPGWSAYYLDYKFLKKIISSLASNRPASEAAALALGVRPADILNQPQPSLTSQASTDSPGRPPIFTSLGDDDRGPDFQAHKAAFFFKLERELEKINAFYLQKEAELKLRLETLLSKRRAAAMRNLPDPADDSAELNVEWSAVEEGFRLLERDLGKLQQYVEINATGFRKILKKFDKRSTSATKELYLARRVDIQPVFNRQLISELSDTVAACLLDLTDLSSGLQFEGSAATDIFTQQLMVERAPQMGPYRDLENSLRKAVTTSDRTAVADCVRFSDSLSQQNGGKPNVTRILWNVVLEAPPDLADLILASLSIPFDFQYVDDINGRTCLHEASIAGTLRLVNLCLKNNVQADKLDVYGRSAMHYAAMYGYPEICRRLLEVNVPPTLVDRDNCSPLVYATLRGSVQCVQVLLEDGHVPVQPSSVENDLIPLAVASQSGHVDVLLLLLQHGAKCLPNTNGEYPMHLAAREGHVEVCKLLLHLDGWDTPDKYHEWTPIFHAARYGHNDCIQLLLKAGCKVDSTDEMGNLAVHYAAWYGHHECVNSLLHATPTIPPTNVFENPSSISPRYQTEDQTMSEIDMIPSLSLPPPIMPHRVYGHNYLDKTFLVQVTIGHAYGILGKFAGVTLHPRLINPTLKDEYLLAPSPLKLVMSTDSDTGSAPYTVSLPQREPSAVFAFQIPSLDKLSLKFSIYPSFGTKTIGRAVALPSLFRNLRNTQQFVLPILDNRLHVIGEVPFEVNVITPFENVRLEIGGDVETYWKSTGFALPTFTPSPSTGITQGLRQFHHLGSNQTSPSVFSIASSSTSTRSQALTVTSVRGDYIYVVVQVTKDLHPVVYSDWRLPEPAYDLGVSDVTLSQFEALALKAGRNLPNDQRILAENWPHLNAMVSLVQLLHVVAVDTGMSLELAYPSQRISQRLGPSNRLQLNSFVDSVLRTVYRASSGSHGRRRIVFSSFSPDVCSALNWKQPNYPVFFSSACGRKLEQSPSLTALFSDDDDDRRLGSLGAAVEFAGANNLLGVWVDATLLTQVPSLIHDIKDAGLLVGIYNVTNLTPVVDGLPEIDGCPVDAYLKDGNIVYADLSSRNTDAMII